MLGRSALVGGGQGRHGAHPFDQNLAVRVSKSEDLWRPVSRKKEFERFQKLAGLGIGPKAFAWWMRGRYSFMLVERIQGNSLDKIVETRLLTTEELYFLKRLLRVLIENRIYISDFKPANIMITLDKAVICDAMCAENFRKEDLVKLVERYVRMMLPDIWVEIDPDFELGRYLRVSSSLISGCVARVEDENIFEGKRGPQLSELERNILVLVASGKETSQICLIAGVTRREISRSFEKIYRKLGMSGEVQCKSKRAPSRIEAAKRAMELGLIEYVQGIEKVKESLRNPLAQKQRALLAALVEQGVDDQKTRKMILERFDMQPSALECQFVRINALLGTSLGKLSPLFPSSIWASAIIAVQQGYITCGAKKYDTFVARYITLVSEWLAVKIKELKSISIREGYSNRFTFLAEKITMILQQLDPAIAIALSHSREQQLRNTMREFEDLVALPRQKNEDKRLVSYETLQGVLNKNNIQFSLGKESEEISPLYIDFLIRHINTLPESIQEQINKELGMNSTYELKSLFFGERINNYHWQFEKKGMLFGKRNQGYS